MILEGGEGRARSGREEALPSRPQRRKSRKGCKTAGFAPLIALALLSAGAMALHPAKAQISPVNLPANHDPIRGFDIPHDRLMDSLADLPPSVQAAISADPDRFVSMLRPVLQLASTRYLSPIDKRRSLPPSYRPAHLVPLDRYPALHTSVPGMMVNPLIMRDLLRMCAAAEREGVILKISSAYRSYHRQRDIFARQVLRRGWTQAVRRSARAGHSEHQLGTTIDFGSISNAFCGTAAERWLRRHAREYGFSISYPPGMEKLTGYIPECWHFRHLGREALALSDRFFGGLSTIMLSYIDDNADWLAPSR
ncbi:MAG: M15 family metallopeptidase [Ectothiorhodospiraceae bacterium AqS1]|nr:M15 family metallopeptidase [Ectothiorhodospiraceae bacterium AqS1]